MILEKSLEERDALTEKVKADKKVNQVRMSYSLRMDRSHRFAEDVASEQDFEKRSANRPK